MTNNTLPLILGLDMGGRPFDWLHWKEAVTLHARNEIVWSAGECSVYIHGGTNRITGEQSIISLNTIIAIRGANAEKKFNRVPTLTNRALFARDRHMCLYCGGQFKNHMLSRDHITPKAYGGKDKWDNVVTACKPCNHYKGCRTPQQARLELLAIPFSPNHAEYLILANRRILADQMDFLTHHMPRSRRQGA